MSLRQVQETIQVQGRGQGLVDITEAISEVVRRSGIRTGMCHVFVRHTSASLLIQENADPKVCRDLERFFEQLAPEDERLYTHQDEGPDDMPSHVRSALTSTSELIPVTDGRLGLGTWQGLFLFEHRHHSKARSLIVHLWGE